MKKLLTINEASEIIGIGRNKLRELTENPTFPAVRIGCKKLIIIEKVTEWLYKNKDNL